METLLHIVIVSTVVGGGSLYLRNRLTAWWHQRAERRWMYRPVLDDVAFNALKQGLAQAPRPFAHYDPSKFCLLLVKKVLGEERRLSATQLEVIKEHLVGAHEKEQFLVEHHYAACLAELIDEHHERLLDRTTK